MRHFLVVVFLFVFSSAFSQDTIVMYDGRTVIGKALEVSSKEIRYKTADNPNGPVYMIRRSRVKMITYQNGKQEIFNAVADRNELFMTEKMARHLVYAEVSGNGVNGWSFNYDYTFYRKAAYGFTVRFGINPGFSFNEESNYLVLPLTGSFIYGNEATFELGVGAILANYTQYRSDGSWILKKVKVTQLLPTGIFGFRYQKINGFSARMSFTPFLLMKRIEYGSDLFDKYETRDQNLFFTLGISAGYAF